MDQHFFFLALRGRAQNSTRTFPFPQHNLGLQLPVGAFFFVDFFFFGFPHAFFFGFGFLFLPHVLFLFFFGFAHLGFDTLFFGFEHDLFLTTLGFDGHDGFSFFGQHGFTGPLLQPPESAYQRNLPRGLGRSFWLHSPRWMASLTSLSVTSAMLPCWDLR